jgi:hypothetical protein
LAYLKRYLLPLASGRCPAQNTQGAALKKIISLRNISNPDAAKVISQYQNKLIKPI